jgi:hypothetical protein
MHTSLSWLSWFLPFVLTVQHTQHRYPCFRRDSNPQSQQASCQRPTSQIARPPWLFYAAVYYGHIPHSGLLCVKGLES